MTVKPPRSPMLNVSVIDRPLGFAQSGVSAEDTELVAAIRRGDPGSREALYHRYKRRVFALALRIVGASDAEEVSQEAFIRIFRGLPKFRGDSALGTWIYRLSVNAALSHRSRRGAVPGATSSDPEVPDRGGADRGSAERRRRAARAARTGAVAAAGGLPHRDRPPRRRGARARGGGADPRLPRRHVEVAAAQGARQAARDPAVQDGITSSELEER